MERRNVGARRRMLNEARDLYAKRMVDDVCAMDSQRDTLRDVLGRMDRTTGNIEAVAERYMPPYCDSLREVTAKMSDARALVEEAARIEREASRMLSEFIHGRI